MDKKQSVKSEIAVARVLIQKILDECKKPHDYLLYSSKLNNLFKTVERLVTLEHKLLMEQGKMR